MSKPKKATSAYARAGVDIDLGNQVKSRLPALIRSTHRPEVLSKIGQFGGLFDARFKGYRQPVLVSSVDGVGTKLKVAAMADKHDTVGEDLVNHCINDIAVLGAEPLFFLDYIGVGKLEPKVFEQLISGLVRGCKNAGCALIGGETAQMPGLYHGEDYDLAGTIVGLVDKAKLLDGSSIRVGDVVIGFPSSGLHTNGFSLARKILFEQVGLELTDKLPGTKQTLSEALLAVHVNYQPLLKKLSKRVKFKGLAHITGGGFVDNIPRVLPKGTAAEIRLSSWEVPPLFQLLASRGELPLDEAYQVFNMGIGMVAIVTPRDAKTLLKLTKAYAIGSIIKGRQDVKLIA